jgi:hypothetical protein
MKVPPAVRPGRPRILLAPLPAWPTTTMTSLQGPRPTRDCWPLCAGLVFTAGRASMAPGEMSSWRPRQVVASAVAGRFRASGVPFTRRTAAGANVARARSMSLRQFEVPGRPGTFPRARQDHRGHAVPQQAAVLWAQGRARMSHCSRTGAARLPPTMTCEPMAKRHNRS